MKIILTIAMNTFRETIRDRILYNLLLFAVGILGIALIVSRWSIDQQVKILIDFGLTVIMLFALLIGIFIGIGLVYKEIDRKTILAILSKPIHRWQFIVGKYAGLQLTLLLNFLLMALALSAILRIFEGVWNPRLCVAIGMIYVEMLIIMAFAVLFSSFTTPTLSALLCIFVFLSGHLSSSFRFVGPGFENHFFQRLLTVLYYVLPNLEFFNFRTEVVHGLPLPAKELALSVVYGMGYATIIILIAIGVFQRRDFK